LSSIETPRRVILLGASNVWFSQAWWLPALRQDRNGPCEVLGAYGHGRSYGLRSRVGFRQLESILRCGLWRALDEGPTLPTTAVIADVGNDIAYGVAVDRLLGWVEECVGRLLACGAGVTVSGLPTESVSRLSPASFSFLRRLLFPTHSIDREEAISRMGAAEKGLDVLLGTDGKVSSGTLSMLDEMGAARAAAADLDIETIWQMAIVNPRQWLARSGHPDLLGSGTLKEGDPADLVAVSIPEGDGPLLERALTGEVLGTWIDGRALQPEMLEDAQ